jgi:nucleotide-binding universal stress UspA family protein
MKPIRKILIALDLSEPAKEVVEAGLSVARSLDASVEIVHVREPFVYAMLGDYGPTVQQEQALMTWIDRSLEEAANHALSYRVPCVTTSLHGSPAREIVSHAQKVGSDLIVVGTHGRGAVAHAVLGSVAERVVQRAGRPVLVVPVSVKGR